MPRTVSIGCQDFETIKREGYFYVDKTLYADRGELFAGLNIWKEEKYRDLQGTYPVIMLSFADVKETSFVQTRKTICRIIKLLYNRYDFLLEGYILSGSRKKTFAGYQWKWNPSDSESERFYHGFVLGMMVELADRYVLTSNRESGFENTVLHFVGSGY